MGTPTEKPIRCIECGHWTATSHGMYSHSLREHRSVMKFNGSIIKTATDRAFEIVEKSIADTEKNKYEAPENVSDKISAPVLNCLKKEKTKSLKPYSHLRCLYCENVQNTSRRLYLHTRYEHGVDHTTAISAVNESILTCKEQWGDDIDLQHNQRDIINKDKLYESQYECENIDFFDIREF